MNHLISIFLMAPPADGKSGGSMQMLLMFALIIVVFYFFMIRPQVKRQKEQKKFRDELKEGDKVVTIGGIHGKITDVQDTTFTVEISDGVKITIEKAAVAVDGNDAKK